MGEVHTAKPIRWPELMLGTGVWLVGGAALAFLLSASGQAFVQDLLGEAAWFADRPELLSSVRALLAATILPFGTVLLAVGIAARSVPELRGRLAWGAAGVLGTAVFVQSLFSRAWAMETMPSDGLVIGTTVLVLGSLYAAAFALSRPLYAPPS